MDYLLGRNALNTSYITGYGDVYSENQHSRWFADSLEPTLPNPPRGSVSGGPNSNAATWDPVIKARYDAEHLCAPQLCYVDDIQSWSTNEITVNWNSALSWVASFVADQEGGDASSAGAVVRVIEHPQDTTVPEGEPGSLGASATGAPAPVIQWQRLVDGAWTDLPGATSSTLQLTVRAEDVGEYRARFSNDFGGVYTDSAILSVAGIPVAPVVPPSPTTPLPGGTAPGAQDRLTPPARADRSRSGLALTGAEARWLAVGGTALVVAGIGAVLVSRRARRRVTTPADDGEG